MPQNPEGISLPGHICLTIRKALKSPKILAAPLFILRECSPYSPQRLATKGAES
jgi:hypothetical protein